ncbi:MAG: hypothetical protein ACYTAF_02830, partial [Planctomycetota bacterium]
RWAYPKGEGVTVREGSDLAALLNEPLNPRKDPLIGLYRFPDGVAVRWQHSLMDARGCEDLLLGRTSDIDRGREYDPDIARHRWWRRTRIGFRARTMLRVIDRLRPANFDHEPVEGPKHFSLKCDAFSPEETSAIFERAAERCGHFQKNLYLLACTFRALDAAVSSREALVIPVPANLRKKEWSPVLGNYLTFFHMFVERRDAKDMGVLVERVKAAQTDQISRRIDEEMILLMLLGRKLGLKRYLRERTDPDGRERVTAYFSYPGEARVKEFLGRRVLEYRTFPAVPARPGLGVFFGVSGDRLLLTTVFVRENVREKKVDEFVQRLKETL